MAISVVQNITASGTTSAISAHFNSTVTAGNIIIVGIIVDNGTANRISSVTDNASNTYSRISSKAGTGQEIELWAAYNVSTTGGATQTITANANSGDKIVFAAIEASGIATTSAFDQAVSSSGNGATLSSGTSSSTVQANELIVVIGGENATRPMTAGSGYTMETQIQSGSQGIGVETKTVSSTGTQSGTITLDEAGHDWTCLLATFSDTSVSATTKTQTGISRVTAVPNRTQTGKARVTATTTNTQAGKSRVQISTSRTQTGVSRVTAVTSRTQTGKTRITATTAQTQTGKSRVGITSTKTQTGTSRIQSGVNATQAGKARLTASASQTQTGKSRVTVSTSKTQTGISQIGTSPSRTQTGKARVTASVSRTQTGVSRISKSVSRTQNGLARIAAIVQKNQSGTSRVTANATRIQNGTADIRKTVSRTQSGLAKLLSPVSGVSKTVTGVARIINGTWYSKVPQDWLDQLFPEWETANSNQWYQS